MSVKTIEKLLSNLIKNGDQDTLETLIELLGEIKDFKKDSPKPIQESNRTFSQRREQTSERVPERKPVQVPKKSVEPPKTEFEKMLERANLVTGALEEEYANGRTKPVYNRDFSGGGSTQSIGGSMDYIPDAPYNPDMMNYADNLL